jgi:hypothetical protein
MHRSAAAARGPVTGISRMHWQTILFQTRSPLHLNRLMSWKKLLAFACHGMMLQANRIPRRMRRVFL